MKLTDKSPNTKQFSVVSVRKAYFNYEYSVFQKKKKKKKKEHYDKPERVMVLYIQVSDY